MGSNNGGGMIMIVMLAACACCVLLCMGSSAAVALNENIRAKLGIDGFWNDIFNGGGTLPTGADGEVLPPELPADETSTASDCETKGNCPNNTQKSWLCPDPFNGKYFLKFDTAGLNPKCCGSANAGYTDSSCTDQPLAYDYRDLGRVKVINTKLIELKDKISGKFYDGKCPGPMWANGTAAGPSNEPAILFNIDKKHWVDTGRIGCIPKSKSGNIVIQSPKCVWKGGPDKEKLIDGAQIVENVNYDNLESDKNCYFPQGNGRGNQMKVVWRPGSLLTGTQQSIGWGKSG